MRDGSAGVDRAPKAQDIFDREVPHGLFVEIIPSEQPLLVRVPGCSPKPKLWQLDPSIGDVAAVISIGKFQSWLAHHGPFCFSQALIAALAFLRGGWESVLILRPSETRVSPK